jgi:catechol 2,3-dioxygenase-like lactoylglutathione lyase family enzyme
MPPQAAYLTTALAVNDIRRSIAFYQILGLELTDYEGDPSRPGWARMHGEGGDLMFLVTERDAEADRQKGDRIFIYLYTEELPALRQHVIASGIEVSEIKYPAYMKSGEIAMKDPDGFLVFVGQWDTETHKNWERERRERLAKFDEK